MNTDFAVVMTTFPGENAAEPVIEALLAEEFATCIQVTPISSHYIWDGKINHEQEVLLMIKGKASNFDGIKGLIERLHPYELPEIVQIPITNGSDRYLAWLADPY